MSAVRDLLESANESVLELVTTVQEQILETSQSLASAVGDFLPDPPSWLPSIDTGDAKGTLEQVFDLQVKLLEKNRDFTLALLDSFTPAKADPAGAASQ